MRHINTDPGARRLFTAIVLSVLLHGAIATAFFLGPSALSRCGAGNAESDLHPVSFTLEPSGSATSVGSSGRASRAKTRVGTKGFAGSQSATKKLNETSIADHSKAAGTDSSFSLVDASVAAESAGAGEGLPGGIVGESAGGASSDLFLSWLDVEIRKRLSYPERARQRNLEGDVVLLLNVRADGTTCDSVVTTSSGSAILDRAALDLVNSLFPAPFAPGHSLTDTLRIRYALDVKY